jgi:hypothetical protein
MGEARKRFPGFIGPSNETRAQRFDAQRTVNLMLELNALGAGKGQEPAVLLSTPGLKFLKSIGVGPIRALYTMSNQQIAIIVSGSEVYQLSSPEGIPVRLDGNLSTANGPVSIADNGIQCILVDGQNGYYFTIGQLTLNTINDPNFYPADIVSFQDGYFILNQKGTPYFFLSDLYSIDFPELNTAAKAGNSDILIAAYSNNRELYLFGANTMEIWYNSGQSGITPFARQDGRFSQVGCVSPASIARVGEELFWLGTNQQGGGVVYHLDQGRPNRVSTHSVEYAIQRHKNLEGAVGYAYQQEGHLFYLLNIPSSSVTWVFDYTTKQWSERQSTVRGVLGRHLGQVHCTLNNQHLIGDYRNGNIYTYDLDTFTDNGEPRLKLRQAPHISEDLNELFIKLFEIDASFGVGLVDDQHNLKTDVEPFLTLEISRDGGLTWSNAMKAPLGKIGQYNTRARWQRLGRGRDLIFKVTCTDNVSLALLSAFLDAEAGEA